MPKIITERVIKMSLVVFNEVSKIYSTKTKALDSISFDLKEGEFVAIIGSSGAGKSTILRCMNRLIEPTSGQILFEGVNVLDLSKKDLRKVRTKVGMVFQHYNLVERLSVFENILHGRLGHKATIAGILGKYTEDEKRKAFELIKLLGLEEQAYKRCDELSGGQKQRVGIARSIMQEPKLIMCDEPIASLDPSSSKVIMDYLKDINDKMGITCLVNLHQVDVAINYATRVLGVKDGKIVFDGPTDKLTTSKIHDIYGSKRGDLITDVKGA